MVVHSDKIIRAKELRKNATPAEVKLWHAINNNSLVVKFRRQHPVGKYFADFVCIEKKLIIELDGAQHADNMSSTYDNHRTDYMESLGYKLIRIPNGYVFQELDSVVLYLKNVIDGKILPNDYFKSKYDFTIPISPPKIL